MQTAEELYRRAGLIPQFQLTPATIPKSLSARLHTRGYTPDPDSIVMIADAAKVASLQPTTRENVRVDFLSPISRAFAVLTIAGSRSTEDGQERLAILESITHPKACIVLCVDGIPVSSGACVSTREWAGIYVMRTEVPFRRRGHAARVLHEAAVWALKTGAKGLYLQVDGENNGARALYARAGFRDAYRYTYWKLKES
jgi:GNAT superfamily N-acetyltransferase